jgi:two-component system nitrogen regulation response regulator GlnG
MSYRILLVETDAVVAVRLTAALQQAGFGVLHVDGFEDALSRVRQAPVALLITAVRLGPYNGLHLILRARGQQPRLPAIITTPTHDPLVEADATSIGVAYLAKPGSNPVELLDLVARLLGAETV